MPDKNHAKKRNHPGVFDVSKPHRTTPSASSRPLIVGHHPTMPDPMVRRDESKLPKPATSTTVPVRSEDESEAPEEVAVTSTPAEEHPPEPAAPEETHVETSDAPLFSEPKTEQKTEPEASPPLEAERETEAPAPVPQPGPMDQAAAAALANQPAGISKSEELNQTPSDIPKPAETPKSAKADRHDLIGTKPLPIPRGAGPYRGPRNLILWTLSILLLLLLVYVLMDAGVIKTGLNLPIHFFKK